MNDLAPVREFYDGYGTREWERLDASAEARLIYHLHLRFLEGLYGPGAKMLDAGCGPGRFSIEMARAGSDVTLLDLSAHQLDLAREKITAAGLSDRIPACIHGDVRDLGQLPDACFDTAVCYGAVLNYLLEDAKTAVRELVRVTRPGGTLVVSVNSRWGVIRHLFARERIDVADFMRRPDYWHVRRVVERGDLPAHPEVAHPARHFFTAASLRELLTACGVRELEMAAAPAVATGFEARLAAVEMYPEAWKTLLEVEERASRAPGLLDAGFFILARGTV